MRKIAVIIALLFSVGAVTLPTESTVHADLTSCTNITRWDNNLAIGATSQCGVQDAGTTYPLNEQRNRIKCRLQSNPNTWTTKNGSWVGRAWWSSATCDSGWIMTEKTIQKR